MVTPGTPRPRAALLNPDLTRPDWIAGQPRSQDRLWLDRNENADPELIALVTTVVQEVLAGRPNPVVNTYPDSGPLYRKLGALLGVSPSNLLLAAGSDGVIRSVFEAFVEPGEPVVHTQPTFAMYPVYSLMHGARVSTLDYTASPDGPRLGVDTIVQCLHDVRPRVACLPNPDSPTGTLLQPDELRAILDAARTCGTVLLIDEAYHPFTPVTALPWVHEFENLVIARTFAKAWGMAGLRIGYAIAAPGLIATLHKVRPMYEVNTLAVAVTERMLDHAAAVDASVERLNRGRDGFARAMESCGFKALPSGGNFIHVAFGECEPDIFAALDPLVLYRRDGAGCLAGYSRFSATTEERFAPLIAAVRRVAASRKGSVL